MGEDIPADDLTNPPHDGAVESPLSDIAVSAEYQTIRRVFLKSIPDPFVSVDMTGRLIDFNEAYRSMMGYSAEELRRLRYEDLTPKKWHKFEAGILENQILSRGFSDVYEKEYRRKDGTVFPVELRTAVLTDIDGQTIGMWALVRDITDRKRTEQALIDSETRFQTIFAKSREPLGVLLGGTHVLVNAAYAALFGFDDPRDMHGTDILEFAASESKGFLRQNTKLWEQGRPAVADFEFVGLGRGGVRIRVDVSVSTFSWRDKVYFLAVLHDVTEHRVAEETVRKSEEKFYKAFNACPQPASIARLDDMEVYVEINEAFLQTTGLTREQVVGRTVTDIGPQLLPECRAQLAEAVASGEPVRGMEAVYRTDTGELRDLLIYAEVIEIDGVGHIISFAVDVTEQKRDVRRRQEMQEELERRVEQRTAQLRDAVAELESFSYSVSHDLRAPLRAMDGFSNILLQDYADVLDDEGRGYLDRIRNAANRMGRLVDDLLRLSSINRVELKSQRVDLSALARDQFGKLRDLEPGRNVEPVVAPGVVVSGDPALLGSLMQNLLENAWKYTSKNDPARIEFGEERRDGQRVFFVKDDGAGFDMAYAGRLFGAFQRLHSEAEYPGSGIGLATAQRIVHRHGGKIWAEAVPDQGATFSFTLGDPAAEG